MNVMRKNLIFNKLVQVAFLFAVISSDYLLIAS